MSSTSATDKSPPSGASTSASNSNQSKIKIYTKTGDGGQSSLYNGERRAKDDAVFEALGTIDELNSFVGLARSVCDAAVPASNYGALREHLVQIQSTLLDLGAHVATPRAPTTSEYKASRTEFADHVTAELEAWIDAFDADLPPLRNFVLPSGGALSAHLHVCRSVTRRAERLLVPLAREGATVDAAAVRFINRLSDYFFVAARFACATDKVDETIYHPGRSMKKQQDEQ